MAGPVADERTVEAVLTASRAMIAVATRSLGAAAEETVGLSAGRRVWIGRLD